MPAYGIIQEVVFCAFTLNCLPLSHPAAVLGRDPCTLSGVNAGWQAGRWQGEVICWRNHGSYASILLNSEPIQHVPLAPLQQKCAKTNCIADINTQLRNHK